MAHTCKKNFDKMVEFTTSTKIKPARPIIYLKKRIGLSSELDIETRNDNIHEDYPLEFKFCFFCGAENEERNNSTNPLHKYCCESFVQAKKNESIEIIENTQNASIENEEKENNELRNERRGGKGIITFIFNLATGKEYEDYQEMRLKSKQYDEVNPYDEVFVEYCPYCGLHLEAHIFEALGNDRRLKITQMLLKNPNGLGTAQMASELKIANEATNAHLYVLESAGFVYHQKIINMNDKAMNNFKIIPEKRNIVLNMIATARSEGAMIALVSSKKVKEKIGQPFFFRQNEMRIGRNYSGKTRCDISLDNDTSVSRCLDNGQCHATISRKDDEYFLEDASLNGTTILPIIEGVDGLEKFVKVQANREGSMKTHISLPTEPLEKNDNDKDAEPIVLHKHTRKLDNGDQFEIGTNRFIFINNEK